MRYVGFVRNVMHGREGLHRTVLLDLLADAGGADPVSYLATGNVGFDTDDVDVVVEAFEAGIAGVIGRREPIYVRTIAALQALVAADPFAHCPWEDAVERVVSFARAPIAVTRELPVLSRREDCCIFRVDGTEAYGASRLVGGRTSGAGGLAEWFVGEPVTTRSWGTVSNVEARESARTAPRTPSSSPR